MTNYRIEKDSMGDVQVPAQAYYGAQTQRAVENFPISGWNLPPALIRALGLVKLASVIANRAIEMLGGDRFQKDKPVHPNDHVNMGQSTNDIFPTAIHVAVALQIKRDLIPALQRLHGVLAQKAAAWDKIIKIGRTHLADATPLRLGQEIGGFARQIELSVARAKKAIEPVLELPAGGTAVGTGINTHPEFGRRVAAALAKETGLPFIEALDHFEANAQRDGIVEC